MKKLLFWLLLGLAGPALATTYILTQSSDPIVTDDTADHIIREISTQHILSESGIALATENNVILRTETP